MGWSEALARLLRPDRHVMLRLLESQPLTVPDVLGSEPALGTDPATGAAPDPNPGAPSPASSNGAGSIPGGSTARPTTVGGPQAGRVEGGARVDDGPRTLNPDPGATDTPAAAILLPAPTPLLLPESDLASHAAELPMVRPHHEVAVADRHRFAQAVCNCGWLGAARRARGTARAEARDHALLYAGTVVDDDA